MEQNNNYKENLPSNRIKIFKCPFCLTTSPEKFPSEQTKINCDNCLKSFLLITCLSCDGFIFYKTTNDFNYLLNIRVECPYINCKVSFLNQRCLYCTRINKRLCTTLYQSTFIECIDRNCKKKYSIFDCPIKDCKSLVIINEKIHEGKNIICSDFYSEPQISKEKQNKCLMNFFQISCIECFSNLIWRGEKKSYIEGQPVICQNKRCRDISKSNSKQLAPFNKVICPDCNCSIIFKKNMFNFGVLIECPDCLGKFSQCFCPKCRQILSCRENLECEKINCLSCRISFTIVNCLKCRKINIWDTRSYIQGQTIICAYCDNKFNKILCNACKRIIPFYSGDYRLGQGYKCIYEDCGELYKLFICPCCKASNYVMNSRKDLKQIKCGVCGISFFNLSCGQCMKAILCLGYVLDSLEEAYIEFCVVCPYSGCEREQVYVFKKCIECKKVFYFNSRFELKKFKLKVTYRPEKCEDCKKNCVTNYYFDLIVRILDSIKDNERYVDYSGQFITNSKNYFGINFIQGDKFYFDYPELSEIDEIKDNLMIKNSKIYELVLKEIFVHDLPTYEQLAEFYSNLNSNEGNFSSRQNYTNFYN